MSLEAIKEIIAKAVLDVDFRQQLFSERETTLAVYDLTAQEKADFNQLTPEAFDAFSSDIEQRVSKAGLLISPATLPVTAASLGLSGPSVVGGVGISRSLCV